MDQKAIAALHCPQCGDTFHIDHILKEKKGDINYAIVRCNCRRYPVLEGILILQTDRHKIQTIIKELEKGSSAGALKSLFIEPRSRIITPSSMLWSILSLRGYTTSLKKWSCIKRINEVSFCEVMEKLLSGDVRNYFIHRFSTQSFWSIYPLIPLIRETGTPILDFGCGFGHASFIFSQLFPSKTIFCVERSFLKLLLAKNYFVDAEFICLDEASLLPFEDNFFSTVFGMDVFHLISSKLLLAEEFQRVLKISGVLLLPHVHNAYVYNPYPGTPLPPAAYQKLFGTLKTKLIPEEDLIRKLYEDQLDLTKEYSKESINSSNAFTLIGSRKNGIFKCYANIKREFFALDSNLEVNPIYQIREKDNKFLLIRKLWDSYRRECPLAEKILPQEIEIDKRIIRAAKEAGARAPGEESEEIRNLMKKFVLTNTPPNYICRRS